MTNPSSATGKPSPLDFPDVPNPFDPPKSFVASCWGRTWLLVTYSAHTTYRLITSITASIFSTCYNVLAGLNPFSGIYEDDGDGVMPGEPSYIRPWTPPPTPPTGARGGIQNPDGTSCFQAAINHLAGPAFEELCGTPLQLRPPLATIRVKGSSNDAGADIRDRLSQLRNDILARRHTEEQVAALMIQMIKADWDCSAIPESSRGEHICTSLEPFIFEKGLFIFTPQVTEETVTELNGREAVRVAFLKIWNMSSLGEHVPGVFMSDLRRCMITAGWTPPRAAGGQQDTQEYLNKLLDILDFPTVKIRVQNVYPLKETTGVYNREETSSNIILKLAQQSAPINLSDLLVNHNDFIQLPRSSVPLAADSAGAEVLAAQTIFLMDEAPKTLFISVSRQNSNRGTLSRITTPLVGWEEITLRITNQAGDALGTATYRFAGAACHLGIADDIPDGGHYVEYDYIPPIDGKGSGSYFEYSDDHIRSVNKSFDSANNSNDVVHDVGTTDISSNGTNFRFVRV